METKFSHERFLQGFIQFSIQDPDENHDAPDELLADALDEDINSVEENFEVRMIHVVGFVKVFR